MSSMLSESQTTELLELIQAFQEEQIGAEEAARLDKWICDNESARWIYVQYMNLYAGLYWDKAGPNSAIPLCQTSKDAELPPPLVVPSLFSTTFHGTIGYFSHEIPFSFLMGAVLTSLLVLVAWLVPVSNPVQTAKNLSPLRSIVDPKMKIVGKITGMADCKWEEGSRFKVQGSTAASHQSLIPNLQSLVALGDKYALTSGLMEITYDTGAKVVLQGPVTYEVESNGGYLSVGKLTGKLEKKGSGIRGQRSEEVASGQWSVASETNPKSQNPEIPKSPTSSPQSLIPNPFVITTPIATVTDLGTEFGVEMTKERGCEVHVLQGTVEAKFHDFNGHPLQTVQLREGQGRRWQPAFGQSGRLDVIPTDRAKFEQMRIVKSQERYPQERASSGQLLKDPALVAYYTFEHPGSSNDVLPNLAARGKALDGIIKDAAWVDGRRPGKYALLFQVPSDYVRVNVPQELRDLTLATWVCFTSPHEDSGSFDLLASEMSDGTRRIHWRVSQGHLCLTFADGHGNVVSPSLIRARKDRHWFHLAATFDHAANRVQFYIDGRSVGSWDMRLANPISIGAARIGNPTAASGENCRFWMDEMVIAGRAFAAEEVQRMYESGKPESNPRPALRSSSNSGGKPVGIGRELIYNGEFETPDSGGRHHVEGGPTYHICDEWSSRLHAYNTTARNGTFGADAWNHGISSQEHVYPGGFAAGVSSLKIKSWMRAEAAGGEGMIIVFVGNLTNGVLTVQNTLTLPFRGTVAWEELTGTVPVLHGSGTNATNYVEVVLVNTTATAVYWDDLSVKTSK